jgi:O-antigen/teichoic acid export membrane protein
MARIPMAMETTAAMRRNCSTQRRLVKPPEKARGETAAAASIELSDISPAPPLAAAADCAREYSRPDDVPADSSSADSAPRAMPLRVNFSWTLIGNLVYAACQWAMLSVLAHLGKPEMVGQFALGLAVTAPVLMCANLNLRSVQATDSQREYSFANYLRLRLFTTSLVLPIILGIAWFSGYRGVTLAAILIIGLAKSFESLSDIYYGLMQQNEQMRPIAISMMVKGALSLAAMAIVLKTTGSLIWAVVFLAATWALIFFVYDLPQGRRLLSLFGDSKCDSRPQLVQAGSTPILMRLAILAAPMGLVMFLISFNSNVPRYFIEKQLGLRELGIFAALSYLIMASNTVVGALGQSATPRLSHYYATARRKDFVALLAKLAVIATVIGALGVLGAALVGKPLLALLYGAEYSRYGALFVWIMVVSWLTDLGSMMGYGMTAARRFKVQAPLYGAVVIATFISCWMLIPPLGLLGATLAIGVGTGVLLLLGGAVLFLAVRNLTPDSGVQSA